MYDVGPQGLNRYSYALNNPIIYRDPTGHFINGPDDEENPVGDGCVTGPIDNGVDEMVYHENDDDPSSIHYGSPHKNPAGSHRVGRIKGGGNVYMPPAAAEPNVPLPDPVSVLSIMNLGLTIANEPYDWMNTFYYWSQGDFSYWDLVGLLPILSTGMIRHGDDVVDQIKAHTKILDENVFRVDYTPGTCYLCAASAPPVFQTHTSVPETPAIPEPSTLALFGLGALGLAVWRRRIFLH